MLSITGMPGKRNTSTQEENVESNDEIFTDSDLQKAYAEYMTMLAKRYAGIPNRILSFELLAEPTVPNDDLETESWQSPHRQRCRKTIA